jgi:uncharacterized membrane protein YagU involved in acid resistance
MATREGIRIRPDWRAAVWAGIIAGLVFMVLEMILVPLFMEGSPWGPPRMIAAIALGEGVLPPPDTFAPGILAVAVVVHFVLSIVYALILAALIAGSSRAASIWLGAGFGLVLYLVNFYLFTAIFPWFAMARNWISVFSHIMFGLVAGWAYVALRRSAPVREVVSTRAARGWDGVERRYPGATWSGPERRRA